VALAAALLPIALVASACLPAAVRPTPTPVPTPTPSPTPPPTPSPTPGPPTPTPAPTFEVYTVKRGDTLVEIAKRFKTDGRSIAYWNREEYPTLDPESSRYEPDDIKVGWTLKVLRGGAYAPPEDDGESGEFYSPPPDDLDPVDGEDAGGDDGSAAP
jgi:nucleoid-associated protein YgaU